MMKKSIFIVLVIFCVFSCKKKKDNTIIYGYDYYPINQGQFVVYDVLDVFHDLALSPAHDTNRYQIKEVIAESIIDNVGDTVHKLKRFKRLNDTLDWAVKDIWTIKKTPSRVEVVEENDRIIKMIFAIAYDRTWDCNALNNEDEQGCYYENIYEAFTWNETVFDSTVIVEKENFTSFIDYRRQFDVYAKNIGKIQSVYKDLEIDNFDTLDIQKGSEVIYTLVDYGIE